MLLCLTYKDRVIINNKPQPVKKKLIKRRKYCNNTVLAFLFTQNEKIVAKLGGDLILWEPKGKIIRTQIMQMF